MRALAQLLQQVATSVFAGLRQWCGDDAYERYLRSRSVREQSAPALSRDKFYIEQLQKKYARPNRCC